MKSRNHCLIGRSTRGLTLPEALITLVVMGLLATPLIYSLSAMATAERKTMDLAEVSSTLQPLVSALERMVRDSSADTIAAPGNPAFVFANSNRTLQCFVVPNPYDLGTYTQLGTIWYDENTDSVWASYAYPAATTPFEVIGNLSDVRFYPGPTNTVEGNANNNNYAGRRLNSTRSVLMVVTISIDGRDYEHKVIAYSPNVK